MGYLGRWEKERGLTRSDRKSEPDIHRDGKIKSGGQETKKVSAKKKEKIEIYI